MSEYAQYLLNEGRVSIVGTAGRPIWEGLPLGIHALSVRPQIAGDGALVLLDYMEMGPGPIRNLIRLQSDGQVAWQAELPDRSPDCYVSVDQDSRGSIYANTWEGWRVNIDIESGKIRRADFVK